MLADMTNNALSLTYCYVKLLFCLKIFVALKEKQ